MKKSLSAAALCSALVLSLGLATAHAQEAVSRSDAENTDLYFVELLGSPTADGNSLTNVRAEKARFMNAAASAGVEFTVRRGYDTLFNGYAVQANASERSALARIPGVKALWPIEVIQGPTVDPIFASEPNLDKAIAMTRANIVQNSLGYRGTGIKVAIMDTGTDYDHADLGGDGVARSNSAAFPNSRVIAGWDFVGDDFDFDRTPVPDPYPDDCNGHGTHVSGIVGANGGVVGVAPDVKFGAYRVFGCAGSTTSDIMLAAMERAFADGMQVLNMSIGARAQWPQYPTAAASSRLVKKGMVVVASIGNNGPGGSAPDGPFAAGAPGVGELVIGVASYDNAQRAFAVNSALYGYNQASAAPNAPASGSLPLARSGTTTTANDGCVAYAPGAFTGQAVLTRRGACAFHTKALNAQNAGASAVVLYNNVAGALNPTVAGTPAITIPVVAITAAQGATLDAAIAGGPTTLNWTSQSVSYPQGTGGLISGFSSFGMAADLSLKPDIGAPGGGINSTFPLEIGGYGTLSGTSMSSPHVAGAAALLLQARPYFASANRASQVAARLQNHATQTFWSGNPALGFLEQAHRQGAGLLNIEDAILADVDVQPGKLSIGESGWGPERRRLTIRNRGAGAVTYDVSHTAALATGPKNPANFAAVSTFVADATLEIHPSSVTIPGHGGSAYVDVTVTAPAAPDQGQYGGYVVFTPQGGGATLTVPYAGFIGDYQAVPVLTPTVNGFPWLAQLAGGFFNNRPAGATYTMVGDDIPFFLVHLDHHSRKLEMTVTGTDGTRYHNFVLEEFVGRNTSAGGFFAFEFDGNTFRPRGSRVPVRTILVPDGDYTVEICVLKALGNQNDPADYEVWTSPVFTIDRP